MSGKTFVLSKLVKKARLKYRQDRQSILILASLIVLIIIGAIVYFRFIKKGKEQKLNEEKIVTFEQEVKQSISRTQEKVEKLNIHKDDIQESIINETCVFPPDNGTCTDGLVLNEAGCCIQTDNSSKNASEQSEEQLKRTLLMAGTTIVAEVLLTEALPKVIEKSGAVNKLDKVDDALKTKIDDAVTKLDTASKGLLKGGKPVSRQGSKMLAKANAKIAAKIAKKMLVKGMAAMLRILSKLGSGPAGWATLIFEAISLTLDLAGSSNYDTQIDNTQLIRGRNKAINTLYKMANEDGGAGLPMLFPFDMLFPKEAELAIQEVVTADQNEANFNLMTDERFSNNEELLKLYTDMLILEMKTESEPGDEEKLEKMTTQYTNHPLIQEILGSGRKGENSKIQDKKIFDNLVKRIKSRDKPNDYNETDIMLVPEFSNENVIGISLSENGAKKWNANRKSDWLKYYNPFDVRKIPESEKDKPVSDGDILVASYSDTYLTVDASNPGPADNPNIITKKAPKKAAFLYPFGSLVAMCESTRSTGSKTKKPIDPTSHGVSFDTNTGVCNYTRDYCDRYALDFKTRQIGMTSYNNCELSKGQEWAELIVGTEVTRNTRKKWDDRVDAYESGDPGKIAAATALILVDPLGLNQMYAEQAANNFDKNKDEYGTAAAVGIAVADPTGMGQLIYENFESQMAGRDKFCEKDEDQCKKFTATHKGGNMMNWSVRNSEGEIYSRGQGYQNQVKHGEDHEFFIPKGGYFKVSCGLGGQKINYDYSEFENNGRFDVSCWSGIQDTTGKNSTDLFVENTMTQTNKAIFVATLKTIEGLGIAKEGIETGIKETEEAFNSVGRELSEVGDDIRDFGNAVEDKAKREADKWKRSYQSALDKFTSVGGTLKAGWNTVEDTFEKFGEDANEFFEKNIGEGGENILNSVGDYAGKQLDDATGVLIDVGDKVEGGLKDGWKAVVGLG